MANCMISTIRRYNPVDEPSGYIYVVDTAKKAILRRSVMIDPPYRDNDPNPRGGLRGAKGISVNEHQIALANGSMVFRYDPQWNLLGAISHPACSCIHDILYQDEHLWVCSAQTDLLLRFDLAGSLESCYGARELVPAIDELGWRPPVALAAKQVYGKQAFAGKIDFRDPGTHEKSIYNRAHVNSVCMLPDGDMLLSLGFVIQGGFARLLGLKTRLTRWGVWPALMRANCMLRGALHTKKYLHSDLVVRPKGAKSAVIRIRPDGSSRLVLTLPDVTAPSHSLLPLADGTVIYLHTTRGEVINFNPENGATLFTTKVSDGFLRGAALLSAERLLVGSNGELLVFDLPGRRVVDRIPLSDDPKESVYDIKLLPEHYALPPESFAQHFQAQAGFPAEQIILNGYRFPKA